MPGLLRLGSSCSASLARAFDRLYGVPSRHPVRQRALSLALLQRLGVAVPLPAARPGPLALALGLAAGFALFLLLYWRLPHVRQGYRDVWRGATAAGLLIAATQLFPLYARFAPTGRYGALLGFSLLLATWLYLLAHIALVGAAARGERGGAAGVRPGVHARTGAGAWRCSRGRSVLS